MYLGWDPKRLKWTCLNLLWEEQFELAFAYWKNGEDKMTESEKENSPDYQYGRSWLAANLEDGTISVSL